jgi:hypothetical protein
MQQVVQNTEIVLQLLGAPSSEEEKDVQKVIDRHGGPHAVLHHPGAVEDINEVLYNYGIDAAPVTSTVCRVHPTDLDELLAENEEPFERKLADVQSELKEAIRRSAEDVKHHIDEGPCD